MTSLTWIKRITGIGLSLMSPDAQKERISRVFNSNGEISGPALAELIDECKTSAALFLSKHSGILGAEDEGTITEILEKTDGKQIVANMDGEEDVQWLLELKETVCGSGFSVENLRTL